MRLLSFITEKGAALTDLIFLFRTVISTLTMFYSFCLIGTTVSYLRRAPRD